MPGSAASLVHSIQAINHFLVTKEQRRNFLHCQHDYTSWKLRIFSAYFEQFNHHIPDANENKGVAETAPLIL